MPKIRRSDEKEFREAWGAEDLDRHLAPAEREGLQHSGQPEVVIGVVVREEDLAQVDQPDRGPQQLALRSLAAVEQQAVAPRRTRIALGARFAVGIEPAVPKKTRSRSTREGYARPVPGDDVRELLRRE